MPFNIFEFSMLGEVVAVEAGLEPGNLSYFAGSMHLYERDVDKVNRHLSEQPDLQEAMPPMPRDEDEGPLRQLKTLGEMEARIRHKSMAIDRYTIGEWIDPFNEKLAPYWAQIGLLLLCNVAKRIDFKTLEEVTSHLDPVFERLAQRIKLAPRENSERIESSPLFGPSADKNVVVLESEGLDRRFTHLANSYELEHGPIGSRNLLKARRIVFQRLAARGESDSLTYDLFKSILRSVSG